MIEFTLPSLFRITFWEFPGYGLPKSETLGRNFSSKAGAILFPIGKSGNAHCSDSISPFTMGTTMSLEWKLASIPLEKLAVA